jgi:hypothetical protein
MSKSKPYFQGRMCLYDGVERGVKENAEAVMVKVRLEEVW